MERTLIYICTLLLFSCNFSPSDRPESAAITEHRNETDPLFEQQSDPVITAERDASLTLKSRLFISNFEKEDVYPAANYRPDSTQEKALIAYPNVPNYPPVFKPTCWQEQNPVACSDEALLSYLGLYTSRYKGPAQTLTAQFRLDRHGHVIPESINVAPSGCISCQDILTTALREMPKWFPALQDGATRGVHITLPVSFRSSAQPEL